MKITKALLRNLIKEALEDRINPDDDDLEQAGFRPVPDEMGLEGKTFNFQVLRTDGGTKLADMTLDITRKNDYAFINQ